MSLPATHAALRDLLVDLYPTEQSSRRVVDEAGLAHGRIAFQDAAIDNWHAILTEAYRHGKVANLVEVAKGEYPESSDALEAAYHQYLEAPILPPGPYRWNLALLLAAMVLLPMWFYLHLYPLVASSLAVGALGAGLAAGALAAWKLISSFLGDGLAEEGRSRVEKVLRNPKATGFLAVALAVVLVLCLTTSSVYLIHDRDDLNTVVMVARDQSVHLEASPQADLVGRPVFFNWPGSSLRFDVKSPVDFEIRAPGRRLVPWRRLELRASRDLAPLPVVRIAASSQITTLLPEAELTAPLATYSLVITIGGSEHKTLSDVRRGLVYLAANEDIADASRSREKAAEMERSLTDCAFGRLDQMMPFWRSGFQFLAIPQLLEGKALKIELFEDAKNMLKSSTDIDELPQGIHSACLH